MDCTFQKREDILDFYPEEEFVFYDNLDDAIIGTCIINGERRIVYSVDKIISCLIEQNNWSYDEAFEWFDYNIQELHFEKYEPVLLYDSF